MILLDCCNAGRGNIGDGKGVTQLIAACNYKAIANGVGTFSFTNHLIIELRILSATRRLFTVGELYERIYNRMQSHLEQGITGERYPAPVRLFLTRDRQSNRTIELSPLTSTELEPRLASGGGYNPYPNQTHTNKRPRSPGGGHLPAKKKERLCGPTQVRSTGQQVPAALALRSAPDRHSPADRTMLFAVRLDETMTAESLAIAAFKEWFRKIPASVRDVSCSLEAQFLCDSSLILLRVPISVWACLKDDPAIVCLGPVRSSNLLSSTKRFGIERDTERQTQEPLKPSALAKKVTFAVDNGSEMILDAPSPTLSAHEIEDTEPVVFEKPRRSTELVGFTVSGPAEIYVRNIRDKYPNAEAELVQRLGQANWERHVKVRKALDRVEEQEDLFPIPEPSLFKPSSFRDSGLGTTIKDSELRAYEPSLATSFASQAGDADIHHFRVPPMPALLLGVTGFTCPYCAQYLTAVKNRRDWK